MTVLVAGESGALDGDLIEVSLSLKGDSEVLHGSAKSGADGLGRRFAQHGGDLLGFEALEMSEMDESGLGGL